MFPHKLLLPLGALLLSGLVGASSSGAQDALFVRTQGEIERLWSSALGCAERGSSFAIRDRFNGSESTYGSLPAGGSSDYSQCGERALRNTSSRMLVDTIEDAVRSGGLSLFNSDFRLDSSINWIWGENVTGDLDAVVPLLLIGKEDQGSGHALFLQPGLSFWPGLEDERRLDGNLGVVYRTRMADGLVAGGSFFYDYDVKNDNRRIGVGLDLQDRALHAGLNYYHPLNEWQEGRTDYEEQPLQGGDFRLGLALQRAWLDASMGVWRFEGEGKTKWRPSLGMDAGIRILPGVFLKGGYEWQDEDDSFGTRWSTGLAFRFALPGLDGAGSFNSPPVPAPNLFDPVEREKRILYEEREAVPKANLSVSGTGNTRNVIVQLDEIFTEDVVLNFIGSGSATYNDDWTMSVGGTDCAAVTGTNCQVTVMAGETSPSDGVVITFQDPDRGEPAEDIILSVEIASTGVDLAPGNPLIVQIPAGLPLPNISLSSDKTSIAEGDTATITLTLSEMLGDAAAFNLIGSSDSNDVTYGTSTDDDWNLSIGGTACDMASGTSCQVTIAAGATSAEVTVEVNADTTNETSVEAFTVSVAVDSGSRNIVQTGSRSTLNFTIPADPPLPTVSLNSDKTNIAEGDTATITLTLSEMLRDDAAFNLIGGSDSNDVTYGASNDWNLSIDGTDCDMASGTSCQVTIAEGGTSAEVTVEVNADTTSETSLEAFTVSVEVDSGSRSIVQTGSRSTLNFTIPADPPLPTVSLNSDKTSIAEGDMATITLTLSEMLGDAAAFNLIGGSDSNDVTYGASNDWNLSIDGTDCDMASGMNCQVTIAGGATSAEVTVEVNADTINETSAEAFTVSVEVDSKSRSIVQTGSRSTLNFTIPADPPLPTVSLSSDKTNIAEGDTAIITLTLSEMLGDAAAFNLIGGSDSNDVTYGASNDWNLSIDGTDCDMASGMNCQVTIAGGATSAEVTVEVNADTINETSAEAFTVSVEVDSKSRSIVQTGSRSTLNFTIPEDPPSTLGFAETGITTDETISAGSQFIQLRGVAKDADGMKFSSIPVRIPITISITNNAGNDITIDTSPGQALTPANTDNFNSDNEFLIQAIRIVDDTDTEDQEEFVITLGEGPGFPAGWAIDPDADTFTITINKNDQPSTLGFAETGITTDETISAGNQFIQVRGVATDADGMKFSRIPVRIPITISITNNAGNDISIDTSPGQALTPANTDNFNSDNEFLIQAIRIVDDTDAEEQEEFVVTLGEGPSFPSGWAIDPDADTFTITINRNDQPSTLGFAGTGITTDETISTGNQFIQLRGVAKDADGMKFSSIPVRIPITISITNNAGNDITIDTSSGQALTPAGTDNFNSDNEFLIQAIRIVDDTDAEDQEEFVITLGEGPSFPDGWVIDSDADTFTIVINGNDRPTVFFSGGDGTQSVPRTITDTIDEGAGGSATVTLNLSPAPTTAINIPLTVTGNHAVYGDVIIANTTRAAVLGNPSTNDVRVSVPANIGMVILRITVVQDSGNNSDDITVSLGALPGDYAAGTNNSWAVAINFPRTVNFAYEGEHSLRTSTNPETAEVADLSLELSKTHNEDITVHLNKGGTAGATNGDYRILNQDGSICGADNEVCVVTFPPGQKEAVVKFWPRRYFSGSETAIINIQIPEGSKDSVQLGKQDEIQFNLIDGTASAVLPTVTLSYTGDRILTSSTTSEIAEIVDLKVQLNNSSSVPIAVHLNKGGTTRAGSGDYRILNADDSICGNDDESCIVTFLAGQTEVVVKFWPRRYIAEQETAVIELEVPAENRDKVALGLNNRVEFTLVPGI